MNKEKKIADILSTHIDNLNSGFAPSIDEVLSKFPEISTELREILETSEIFYKRFVMKKVSKKFSKKLLKKLMAEMDKINCCKKDYNQKEKELCSIEN